ncbi:hypothetical protein A3A74_01490 [Candidatus Roizmanbacteria bacterium RIFCSPLOWO2_01_FULL_35_13]|uniref:Methyltransferase domain-containing protein n=1 Tax=Candidatus Roizmanbacteria bacterium RIFCSPLOWO2_01_FULL_35_13 TaxID=1802055 RepID=A0A1F7IEF3_9BACT|nr:MAG: hypothetical protein A3A74_01490 [Candidatus Roizmanbacteria bacterium RIFCSPLOWO2_01_FULL_35_13]
MKKTDRKDIHEKYHKKTKAQHRIIDEKNFTYRIILSVINKYLKGRKKILDIGCGAGTIDFYLADKGHDVTGIDISGKAIGSCIQTAKNLGLKNVKFKQVNFPKETISGKFDFIICSEVIEHLEDDKLAIEKIVKLLKKGGILILTTPSESAPLHKWGLTKAFDKRVGHLRRYYIGKINGMITISELKILESKITEGPLRNFLFINPVAGKFVKVVNRFFSGPVTIMDNFTVKIFGGSDIIIVAKKLGGE